MKNRLVLALMSALRNIKHCRLNVQYRDMAKKGAFDQITIISETDTVQHIVDSGSSVARFGDGEFRWISGISNNSFQEVDLKLSHRLAEVLKSNDESLMVCVPQNLVSQIGYTTSDGLAWKKLLVNNWTEWRQMIDIHKTYYDANFTRPYIDRIDKDRAGSRFDALKKIWQNKSVLIVEGEYTRFGVGNDLFQNNQKIGRVICPATNAFAKYEEILDKILDNLDGYDLVLIALGPTATVLAYDLNKKVANIQAIDIGHLDIEYEWYKSGVQTRKPVDNKYVNEVKNSHAETDSFSPNLLKAYESEIIAHIG